MEKQFRSNNLQNPSSLREQASELYVLIKNYDPGIIKKNTAHVDFNDKKLDNVRFVKVNSMPAVGEHVTAIYCVDKTISINMGEPSLLGSSSKEKLKLNEQISIFPNSILTSPKTTLEIPTKNYVYSLSENKRKKCDLSLVCNDQNKEFYNNKLTILDSNTLQRNPNSEKELSNKTMSMIN